jgi:hypothetical protein
MDYASARAHDCRLTEYTHRSLKHLALENGMVRVTVLVDKGADIVEFRHKRTDTDFLWKERVGLREPARVIPTIASSLGGNLDWYEGGWHECLPGGGPAVIHGAEEGLHGEAALLPWSWTVEEDTPGRISVRLGCRLIRLPLAIHKRLVMESGAAVLRIEETIENESDVPLSFLWGQHPTFGAPFLDGHCRIDVPARAWRAEPGFTAPKMTVRPGERGAWPLAPQPGGGVVDLSQVPPEGDGRAGLVCLDVEDGWYALTNRRTGVGFGLRWDARLFPCLYYWHVFNGIPDYPWFAAAYVVGLEPWTSFPMNHDAARAAGTALSLPPRGSISTTFAAVAYEGREGVTRIAEDGGVG